MAYMAGIHEVIVLETVFEILPYLFSCHSDDDSLYGIVLCMASTYDAHDVRPLFPAMYPTQTNS